MDDNKEDSKGRSRVPGPAAHRSRVWKLGRVDWDFFMKLVSNQHEPGC